MHNWLRWKKERRYGRSTTKQWERPWFLSLLLAGIILLVSFLALLSAPHQPLPLKMSADLSQITPVDRPMKDRQFSQQLGDRPPSEPAPFSQESYPRFRWQVDPDQPFAEQPIIWIPEPALPFSGEIEHLPPDIRRIVERGNLVVALPTKDAFPFFYRKELDNVDPTTGDELAGLDIQLARSLAAYLGVEVTFNRSSPTFDGVVNQVFEGEVDLAIAKISQTLNRARKIHYSQPYVQLRPGLLFNRLALSRVIDFDLHQNPVDAIQQLGSDAKLGVIRASSYASFVRGAFPNAQILDYADWDSLVDAIIHGRVLAGCRDELAIKHEILMRPDANVQMQSVVIDGWIDNIAMVLPWESESLRDFVNQYLTKADLRFTADQLLTHYLNVDARHPLSS